jgi:hypothetical protein
MRVMAIDRVVEINIVSTWAEFEKRPGFEYPGSGR